MIPIDACFERIIQCVSQQVLVSKRRVGLSLQDLLKVLLLHLYRGIWASLNESIALLNPLAPTYCHRGRNSIRVSAI